MTADEARADHVRAVVAHRVRSERAERGRHALPPEHRGVPGGADDVAGLVDRARLDEMRPVIRERGRSRRLPLERLLAWRVAPDALGADRNGGAARVDEHRLDEGAGVTGRRAEIRHRPGRCDREQCQHRRELHGRNSTESGSPALSTRSVQDLWPARSIVLRYRSRAASSSLFPRRRGGTPLRPGRRAPLHLPAVAEQSDPASSSAPSASSCSCATAAKSSSPPPGKRFSRMLRPRSWRSSAPPSAPA